ncbi:MAG: hypothetical protein ACK4UO_13925 [Pseudolabrys sp.]
MATLLAGAAMFAAAVVVLRQILPRNGQPHRLVATFLEPLVAIAICAGLGLGFTLILSGIQDQLG